MGMNREIIAAMVQKNPFCVFGGHFFLGYPKLNEVVLF